ncbi:MAG: protein translocase subunit SecF [Candidatus Gastranaerophilales bacterium]|nr:protein translocase subunit SecF [Candidatus Gastranaerophilales bacterium]MCM1073829.1 protein translocase subunit SecF [Bacteroides sp.]
MKLDIVKNKFIFLALSAILLIPGIAAMIYSMIHYDTHTPVRVGIDYTGGTTLQYGVKEEIGNDKLSAVRAGLEEAGIDNPSLQIINVNSNEDSDLKAILSVRTKFIEEGSDEQAKVTDVVASEFENPQLVQVASVGPTLGQELFKNSLIALSLALLGIIAYLTFRFQFDYALAAILGLVHDTIFVLGVFSILGLVYGVQIDALFVTALLTVIGFSVHDTIVVFDRVRENLKYYSKKMTFGEIMNASINQTLARSINTSITTLITLAALYFFGGVTTKDFVLAMMLGIAIGTYSSIFFCSSLIEIWEDKKTPVRA